MTARIALDAMGGDHAPFQVVLGAIDATAAGIDVVLVGDAEPLERVLADHGAGIPVVHAPEAIAMEEDPGAAIRAKKNSSVTVCARLVASGEAAGMVSAGSTGAALAAAAIVIGRAEGVSRPAIAAVFPAGHRSVVLDVGANIEARPLHLAQFGVMGAKLAQVYLDRPEPSIGLLNIGEEVGKGRELEKEAHTLLAASGLNFVGNVEGRDLGRGTADVFVTDGFTGNVLLKTAEGTARAVGELLLDAVAGAAGEDRTAAEEAATVMPHLMAVRNRLDPESFGGAHLIGTRGTVVIAHGSSSRLAIANAVLLAAEGAERGLVGMIEAGIDG
jgi:glycerol-3-phosphate acyltransferase PlsX